MVEILSLEREMFLTRFKSDRVLSVRTTCNVDVSIDIESTGGCSSL